MNYGLPAISVTASSPGKIGSALMSARSAVVRNSGQAMLLARAYPTATIIAAATLGGYGLFRLCPVARRILVPRIVDAADRGRGALHRLTAPRPRARSLSVTEIFALNKREHLDIPAVERGELGDTGSVETDADAPSSDHAIA
jgi:hypothetical protein